ncbi:MAG: hypothetical protein Q9226_009024 [Calogaya cf. arnoldii]
MATIFRYYLNTIEEDPDGNAGTKATASKVEDTVDSTEMLSNPMNSGRSALRIVSSTVQYFPTMVKYYEDSTRCFILYGRGKYDYGITPNPDQQLKLDGLIRDMSLCILIDMQQSNQNPLDQIWLKSSSKGAFGRSRLLIQDFFELYLAGTRKEGLDTNDVFQQFEATKWSPFLQSNNPAKCATREAKRKIAHKKGKPKMLRLIARTAPGMVEVDSSGEPVWKDEKYGEFVVIATRIDKATGQEVGDV